MTKQLMSAPIALVLSSIVVMAAAQAPDAADKQAKMAALKQSIAENQAALKQYTWVETTAISLKGEVKKQEQKQCYYGADGKVQKTPMPGAAPAAPPAQSGGQRGGRLKKTVVEKKVDDLKDYMEKVAALVKEYAPPDPQRIQAAEAAGNVALQPPTQGLATLTFKNYFKAQDSLALGFDQAAKKIRSYNVNSYVDDPKDDVVTMAVTFASLDDGTSYPQQVGTRRKGQTDSGQGQQLGVPEEVINQATKTRSRSGSQRAPHTKFSASSVPPLPR